jgi:hypothetical protein
MKLVLDAFVGIAAFDKGFPLSVVNQVLGRGCRSHGTARSCHYTYEFKEKNNVNLK